MRGIAGKIIIVHLLRIPPPLGCSINDHSHLNNISIKNGRNTIHSPHHLPQALKECQHLMFSGSFWMKLWHSGNILSRGLCTALPLLRTPWRCCGLGVWVVNNFGMWPLRHWLRVCCTLLLFGGGSSMRALVMKLRLSFGINKTQLFALWIRIVWDVSQGRHGTL